MNATRSAKPSLRRCSRRAPSAIALPDHAYAHIGNYQATLTVTDSGGAGGSVSFAVTVGSPQVSGLAGPAGGVVATEGQACDGLATFTGNAADTYTATVTWGGVQADAASPDKGS